jgi:Transposase
MRQKSGPVKEPAEKVVKDIRRATRRQFSAEEKIRIVLEGLRGEESIAELCRREGIVQNLYYRWSKDPNHNFAHIDLALAAAMFGRENQRFDMRPFLASQVARIAQFVTIVFRAVCGRPHRRPLLESGRIP